MAEAAKADKHKAQCEAGGMEYVSLGMSSLGGIGKSFLRRFATPYFKRLRAEEIKNGGSGFEAIAAKQHWLDTGSVMIARANAAMVQLATLA